MKEIIRIVKLACKILSEDIKFCQEIGLIGTLGIPENDPVYDLLLKNNFDLWLETKGINPVAYWSKFDDYLNTNACQVKYNFTYNPALPAWEQIWE